MNIPFTALSNFAMNDIQRGVKILLVAVLVLVVGLGALTLVGAVVGLAWEFLCRVVPLVLFCAVVLAAVVGVVWLFGRVARAIGGK